MVAQLFSAKIFAKKRSSLASVIVLALATSTQVLQSALPSLAQIQWSGDRSSRSIPVFVHAVSCEPNLLVCLDLPVTNAHYEDTERCRQEWTADRVRKVVDELPENAVVMVRCRYDPSKARLAAENAAPSEIARPYVASH